MVSIPPRCRTPRAPASSWSSPASPCDDCGSRRRRRRSSGPNAPRVRPAYRRCSPRSKAWPASSTPPRRGSSRGAKRGCFGSPKSRRRLRRRRSSSTPAAMSCAAWARRFRWRRVRRCSRFAARSPKPGQATPRAPRCLQSAFRARHVDESHRARLRVEIGRLRKALATVAGVEATSDGFTLKPLRRARRRRARAAERRRACRCAGAAGRRRSLVELGAGAGAQRQPAHRAARARGADAARQSAGDRPRPSAPLDRAAGPGFPDNLVTPDRAGGRVAWRRGDGTAAVGGTRMKRTTATITREYGPFPGVDRDRRGQLRRRPCLDRDRRRARRVRSQRPARRCASSTSPPMREPPSTAGASTRSPATASRRSTRRPAA